MNDKSVNLLEKYDITVNRTSKGRGTIVCEAEEGKFVLKEYTGKKEKLELLDKLQNKINPIIKTDTLVRNKEGELWVQDVDESIYILKQNVDGRECSYKNEEDLNVAFKTMAQIHLTFRDISNSEDDLELPIYYYVDEMEKHTIECKHVYNYLRKLKTKTDFERALLKEYGYFMDKAIDVTKRACKQPREKYEDNIRLNGLYCHGDFQYHNIFTVSDLDNTKSRNGRQMSVCGITNFEHFAHDSGIKDIYLMLRKICEKNDWAIQKALKLLDIYQDIRPINDIEWESLKLRMEYPEKFWKIINFYYNSRKSWIPNRNYEKFEKLLEQERNKEEFINSVFG